jgi:hypothetical protein
VTVSFSRKTLLRGVCPCVFFANINFVCSASWVCLKRDVPVTDGGGMGIKTDRLQYDYPTLTGVHGKIKGEI